jgi:dipeptidyl aminopeptidase/acylaminoacyl peptidase
MATVWDVGSRARLRDSFPIPRPTVGVSFSADGKTLATASPTGVNLWEVATGAALGRIGRGNPADDVAFSPTGDLVAFARSKVEGGGDAEVWNVAKRSRVATLRIDAGPRTYRSGRAFAVAFSPDGHMLATAGDYPLVRLWDVERGTLVRTFEQSVGGVSALEFSPDGTTLAISGFDPAASLWDVSTGTQIGPRLVAGSRATMLDLSPDGRHLLTAAANGQGVVWDVDPASWKRRACELANRTLTRKEWDEFLPGRPYQPACTT